MPDPTPSVSLRFRREVRNEVQQDIGLRPAHAHVIPESHATREEVVDKSAPDRLVKMGFGTPVVRRAGGA